MLPRCPLIDVSCAGRKALNMPQGFGPHGVISLGEIVVTVMVAALALVAFVYMGYRTRRRLH